MKRIAYIRIDYNMKSVSAAVIIEDKKDFFDTIRKNKSNTEEQKNDEHLS